MLRSLLYPIRAAAAAQNKSSQGKCMIELRDLVKTYPSLAGPVTALKGVSLDARAGEMIVVTGKSGSGKTTLVNMIAGLDRNSGGEVWVAGAALHQMSMDRIARWRGKTVGVVFQTFELLPSLTLVQNITLAMDFAGRGSIREQREKALHLLEQVDIAGHAHKLPSEISGGQQQRVAIARALANDPPVLVADEPTGSLDSATAEAVLEIFWNLAQSGRTVVLVTHDRDIARQAQRSIELFDGEIIARSSPSWNLEDDDVGFSLA